MARKGGWDKYEEIKIICMWEHVIWNLQVHTLTTNKSLARRIKKMNRVKGRKDYYCQCKRL